MVAERGCVGGGVERGAIAAPGQGDAAVPGGLGVEPRIADLEALGGQVRAVRIELVRARRPRRVAAVDAKRRGAKLPDDAERGGEGREVRIHVLGRRMARSLQPEAGLQIDVGQRPFARQEQADVGSFHRRHEGFLADGGEVAPAELYA